MDFDAWWIGQTGNGCLLRGENEDYFRMAWEAATKAERDACADICDQEATIEGIAQRCAKRIRERNET